MKSLPRSVCLYGAGELGQLAVDFCEACKIEVVAVVDRSKDSICIKSKNENTYKSISIQEYLEKHSDISLYICIATLSYNSLKESLFKLGARSIYPFYELTSKESMYPLNNGWTLCGYKDLEEDVRRILELFEDEHSKANYKSFIEWHKNYKEVTDNKYIFEPNQRYQIDELLNFLNDRSRSLIDVGAHFGECPLKLRQNRIIFDEIHCFEPDPINYNGLINNVNKLQNATFYNVALYNISVETFFHSGYNYCSRISPNGDLKISTMTLDDYDLKCDFLKIHTEGSELQILQGGIRTIKKYKPAIALSVYHNRDGICNVYDWINLHLPFYKFYFRCHNYQGTGAFLYCIPESSV